MKEDITDFPKEPGKLWSQDTKHHSTLWGKGCEASIKQQHQNWNSVMCQPKEDGTHQAMATTMKQHEEVFLPSKNATIQHKLTTTYVMELRLTQQSNLSDRDHILMPQLERSQGLSESFLAFDRLSEAVVVIIVEYNNYKKKQPGAVS